MFALKGWRTRVADRGGIAAVVFGWMCMVGMTEARGQGGIQLQGLFPPTVDHRPFQSPVKHQAARGTCTAFSVAAVLETFVGVPADLSEQGAYGALKLIDLGRGEVQAGGELQDYRRILSQNGFLHESVAPYDPKSGLWSEDDHGLKKYLEEGKTGIADLVKRAGMTRYAVDPGNLIFLAGAEAANVANVKRLLNQGHRAIAVGYFGLYAPYWRGYKGGVLAPSEGFLYQVGNKGYTFGVAKALRPQLFAEIAEGKVEILKATPDKPDDYGGHAVTIVGYTPEGFIIKNSWGTKWGMNGYAIVGYDYHQVFCDEALAVKRVSIYVQPGESQPRPKLYLKSQPSASGPKAGLTLSLFGPGQGGLPVVRSLRYEVYEQLPDGTRGRLLAFPPPTPLTEGGTGYPQEVLQGEGPEAGRNRRLFWVQVNMAGHTERMERLVIFPNVAWENREYLGH